MSLNVAIFLFADVEALDFAGPYEVFTTAARVAARQGLTPTPLFNVFSVAATPNSVRARAGMQIMPDFTFNTHPPIDVLVVPGGVVTQELQHSASLAWIKQQADQARLTVSVCTGVFLLAQAGVLQQQRVTTHWEDIADLRQAFPQLTVLENCRWVDEGRYITSAGISAGIDMSLHVVARLAGHELAVATARQMEFDWQQSS